MVGHPPPQDLSKPFALPIDPIVAGRHELLLDLPKFGSHALGHWLPSEHEVAAIPTGRAIMREPKEVERLRFAEASSAAVRNRIPTKLDKPRLIGMKSQSKGSEPCRQLDGSPQGADGGPPLTLVLKSFKDLCDPCIKHGVLDPVGAPR